MKTPDEIRKNYVLLLVTGYGLSAMVSQQPVGVQVIFAIGVVVWAAWLYLE